MYKSIEDQVVFSDPVWPYEDADWMQYSEVTLSDDSKTIAIEYLDFPELTLQIPDEDLVYIKQRLNDLWNDSVVQLFLQIYAHTARMEYNRQLWREIAARNAEDPFKEHYGTNE